MRPPWLFCAKFIVRYQIAEADIPSEAIVGRVKKYDSFEKKVKDNECADPFQDIKDICGTRIICLLPSHMKIIDKIICDNFSIIEKDNKISKKPAESFGYLSIHYLATLSKSCGGSRYDDIKNIQFEIQLRTIAAHAWCAVSHHLDYKHPNAIPASLQKQFHALSALFYLADQNFEELYKASLEVKEGAKQKDLDHISKEEINYDTLDSYLRKKLPDREPAPPQHISLLSEELYRAKYRTLSEVDTKLSSTERAVSKVEGEIFGEGVRGFHNVGVVRNSLSIVDENFDKNRISPLRNPEIQRKDFLKYVTKSSI